MTILEVQEKLGTLLETLGLSNVCCRQATGISQAVWHKNTELRPVSISTCSAPAELTDYLKATGKSTQIYSVSSLKKELLILAL